MTSGIGESIKTAAKVIAIIEGTVSFITGMALVIIGGINEEFFSLIIGIVLLPLSIFIAWLSWLMLAGFGQLILTTEQINNIMSLNIINSTVVASDETTAASQAPENDLSKKGNL